jgi:16S rRNA processing protein RimM
MTELYKVGTIANTHGIKGELKIIPNTDFIEERFKKNSSLYIDEKIKVTVSSSRVHKGNVLVSFKEFPSINDVEQFKGLDIFVSGDDRDQLDGENYYYDQIIGLEIFDQDNNLIGTVQDIISLPSNDVWTVLSPEKKEYLIPFISDYVKKVDVENNRADIEVVEGLLN